MEIKAILAAGGTAGHINPAIAIAKEITANGGEVLFIGNETGMEKELIPKEGFQIKTIKVAGFKRKFTAKNIGVALKAAKGLSTTRKIIKDFKPDIVIGCGGYVSGPAVFSAAMMKIPTLIHEQNAFPGMTTKILSRFVNKVCISFKDSAGYIKGEKTVLTGNPVRKDILDLSYEEARIRLNITKPLVLVFGGSLGAEKINDTMKQYVKTIGSDINVLWATGKREYEKIIKELKGTPLADGITITPYIYNMDEAMSAADIVVSRSGAITLGEICAKGKCAVLIPSPYVTNNHQEYNAKALEKEGAAIIINETNLSPALLKKTVSNLIKNVSESNEIRKNALKMGMTNATNLIYKEIAKLACK